MVYQIFTLLDRKSGYPSDLPYLFQIPNYKDFFMSKTDLKVTFIAQFSNTVFALRDLTNGKDFHAMLVILNETLLNIAYPTLITELEVSPWEL